MVIINGNQIDISEPESHIYIKYRLPIKMNLNTFKKSIKEALVGKMPELFLKGDDLKNYRLL